MKTYECTQPFGVYQGLRLDSATQMKAVATIAHAMAIDYFAREGLDYAALIPREEFGVTLSSQRDTSSALPDLRADGFSVQHFQEVIDERHIPILTPLFLGSACSGYWSGPRYLGLKLHQNFVYPLQHSAAVVRQAADRTGGAALPVRTGFSHLSVLSLAGGRDKPTLTKLQSVHLRGIVALAKREVGLQTVVLGRLMVGTDFDKPLPSGYTLFN